MDESGWTFEYDQQPEQPAFPIYKFDQEPLRDAGWHRLNAESPALYRISGGYLQVVTPGVPMSDSDVMGILTDLDRCGPLPTLDELEILVRKTQSGFEMTSHWISLQHGAEFSEFTAKQWGDAYNHLRKLEDEHS